MRCGACDASVPLASGERVGFRDECSHCRADLHACRNCLHHDPAAYNQCRESQAERVDDRERANRCDYFRPAGPGGRGDGAAQAERERVLGDLDQLFKK